MEFLKVQQKNDDPLPPEAIVCERSGLPLRPLYLDRKTGIAKRAIPISWTEGVDYALWNKEKAR